MLSMNISFSGHKSELGIIIRGISQMRRLVPVHPDTKWKREFKFGPDPKNTILATVWLDFIILI